MKNKFVPNIDFLKIVAIVTMAIDHVNHIIFRRAYLEMTAIGRLAFPIFAFILVYNFYYHTHDQKKYLKRLLLFALISQPVFSLVIANEFNIFVTLSLGVVALYLFNFPGKKYYPFLFLPAVWFLVGTILRLPDVDYGVLGVLLVYSLGLFVKDYKWYDGILVLIFLSLINLKGFDLVNLVNVTSTFFVIPIIWFSQKVLSDGFLKRYKYWFYIFYPAHLLVLFIIRLALVYYKVGDY